MKVLLSIVVINYILTHLNFAAYSVSIAKRSLIKLAYLSKNSMPLFVCIAKLSYWSCKEIDQNTIEIHFTK